ncbi:hypothetical protein [Gracilibacillus thailandensis]|uniref:Uncharacterized protein n=1 Tax=Gracilibacillus thailandensis TaxID=563735 RepID=A0A6N7QUE7_9BACI|nr:hypothetical protein [Gracilibacillus thailandensis]MRI65747.1 hypothetical protein [Gracilibacillus thailandensis]
MLSFRAIFTMEDEEEKNNYNRVDVTWYDRPIDEPFNYEYFELESNSYIAWTEDHINFHRWIFKYFYQGYVLKQFELNIYQGHNQTEDEVLFSISHFNIKYKDCLNVIYDGLVNYKREIVEINFIKSAENYERIFSRIILFNNLWLRLANISNKENELIKNDHIFDLPFLIYFASSIEEFKEIINEVIEHFNSILKLLNKNNEDRDVRKVKNILVLLIDDLRNEEKNINELSWLFKINGNEIHKENKDDIELQLPLEEEFDDNLPL